MRYNLITKFALSSVFVMSVSLLVHVYCCVYPGKQVMERKYKELNADIASGTVDENKAVGKKMKVSDYVIRIVNMDIAIDRQ